jgi:iron complex transport system substrate-binding protein
MKVRYLSAALAALIVLALAAACADDGDPVLTTPAPTPTAAPAAAPDGFPVTVVDSNGNELTLPAPATRIVALAPSFVEILFALGAGDSVAGVDENTDYPPEALEITKISGFSPSVEGIAALEPGLVVIFYDPGGLEDALEGLGIATLFLATPDSIEGVYDHITILGQLTGRSEEAEALISRMQSDIEALLARVPAGEGPTVYHEIDNTYFTAGPGSFIHDLYVRLGARNIAEATGEAFPQMSAEAIIAANPEVIILAGELAADSPETVAARPGWDAISAVQNGRVYTIDPNLISRPGPRVVEGLEELARFLYPEAFE